MPTYEYECSKCEKNFEAFQNINDAPLKKCPQCDGKVKRLISSGSGLIFKGSGFYITDYKRKGKCEQSKSCDNTKCPKKE